MYDFGALGQIAYTNVGIRGQSYRGGGTANRIEGGTADNLGLRARMHDFGTLEHRTHT
jgi:hypothetical protein